MGLAIFALFFNAGCMVAHASIGNNVPALIHGVTAAATLLVIRKYA